MLKYNVIILRLSEITLKGKNYPEFRKILISNIKSKLKCFNDKIEYILEYKKIYIKILDFSSIDQISDAIKKIIGVSSLSYAIMVLNDLEAYKKILNNIFTNDSYSSFKIISKRYNKKLPYTSMELNIILGNYVLANFSYLKVLMKNADAIVNVDVCEKNTFIFIKKIPCLGGLPVGSSNRALSLISGGIDSPVASFLAMKRGLKIQYIHFATPPQTSEQALNKVKINISNLKKFDSDLEQTLYIVNFTILQNELMHISNPRYRITIMRRMFFRIANIIAKKYSLSALITGESLGQVASQTIESMQTNHIISDHIILRPLIMYNKQEIIDLGNKINTYETSIMPFDDCCSLFVPKQPIIRPKIKIAEILENEIYWQEIIDKIVNDHIVIVKI